MGAAANEAALPYMAQALKDAGLDENSAEFKELLKTGSAIIGSAIGAATSGTGSGAMTGGATALSGTTFNFLGHLDYAELIRLRAKGKDRTSEENERLATLEVANQYSDGLLDKYRSGIQLTAEEDRNLRIYLDSYYKQEGAAATDRLLFTGISPTKDYAYPYAGSIDMMSSYAKQNLTYMDYLLGRTKSSNENQFIAARTDIGLTPDKSGTADINAMFLPTTLAGRSDQSLMDSLSNSVSASLFYTISSLINVGTEEQRRAGTALVSNLSDIGSSFALQKIGLSPVFGQTGKDLKIVEGVSADGANKSQWYKTNGSINYPPNNGAVPGTEKTLTLKTGQILGRYGDISLSSDYVTSPGSPPNILSLPPTTNASIYKEYIVLKPIPDTVKSEIAAWGGDIGGGLQYKLPMPILELIIKGYIKRIN